MGLFDLVTPEIGEIGMPPGDPGALRGAARTFSASADVVDAHLRKVEDTASSVVPAGWFGIAAFAFRTAVGWAARDLKAAPGAFRTAAGALEELAAELDAAREQADRAQARAADLNARSARLDQAFADATANDADGPDILEVPGLVGQAGSLQFEAMGIRAEAAAAAERARDAARRAAAAFDQVTAMAPSVQRAVQQYLEEHTEEARDRGFLECGVDSVKETGGMLFNLVNVFGGGKWVESWGNLGQGLWYGVTHPGDLVGEASGYNTYQREGLDCAAGEVAPGVVLTILSGGAGAASRAAQGANKLEDVGDLATNARRLDNAADLADNAADARRLSGMLDEVVPGEAIRRINGRLPINSSYAGRVYHLSDVLADKYPAGVRFTPEGFPDFSPYSVTSVRVRNLTGDYDLDAPLANRAAGLDDVPDGYVWHHVEDGNTLMLIPQDLHRAVRHTGGAAVIREGARQVQEAP